MLIYILCDLFIGGSCMGVNSAADTDCSEDVKPIIGMFVPHIIAVYWHVCFLVAFVNIL